jgi:saccharopine dehydrogenase-like NADP-dependent oxidoreductase
MRVVALGGCGVIGAAAVKATLEVTEAEEIVVADQNGQAARNMAEALGDRVTWAEVDVEDAAGIESLLADRDIVLNTVGPYYRFGLPVLKAAIRSNSHYVDINDDWEPTLDMLECHTEARQAGITAIVGLGISPGIVNLMAVRAMRELDTVDTIVTVWSLDAIIREYMEAAPQEGSTDAPGAAAEHAMHQASGTIRVYRDGAFADVEPLQEVVLEYPGIGPVTTYTFGHPEPVTLPRVREDLLNSYNAMYGSPALIDLLRMAATAINSGEMDASQAAESMGEVGLDKVLFGGEGDAPKVPRRFALAKGKSGGIPKTVAVGLPTQPPGGSGVGIGLAAALGVRVLEQRLVTEHGVFAPEDVLDPDGFLDMFARHCDPPGDKAEDILEIAVTQGT